MSNDLIEEMIETNEYSYMNSSLVQQSSTEKTFVR